MSESFPFTTVAFDRRDPIELLAAELRSQLLEVHKLKISRRQDREDAAQNVILRLLKEAGNNDQEFSEVLDAELVRRKVEAERSHVRRQQKRASQHEGFRPEVQESVSADVGFCQSSMDELYELIRESINLTEEERDFFQAWYIQGNQDYAALGKSKGFETKRLHRLHCELRKKLRKIPTILRGIEPDDFKERRHAQSERMPRGARQTSARML